MYDLIVIGAGPGGYTGALKARKLGKTVLLIERDELGGTCLNRGCIPTKSFLYSSKLYKKILHSYEYGIGVTGVNFNYKNCFLRKEDIVNSLRESLSSTLIKAGVKIIKGEAKLLKDRVVEVGGESYSGENILIATGSLPSIPNIKGVENSLTSREVLNLSELPHSITIIGAGVIGIEFASFYSSLGVRVNLIEMESEILPGFDKRLSKTLRESLNLECYLSSRVIQIGNDFVEFESGGEVKRLTSELSLLAVGRTPNTGSFYELIRDGRILVNEYLETTEKGVYGVGDVTGLSFLAHTAVAMAETAVHNMFSPQKRIMRYNSVPSVVYSDPEIASVGLTQDEAKKAGIKVKRAKIALGSNGKYLAENGSDSGSCTVIIERESEKIIGVHLIGTGVSELIVLGVLAIENSMKVDDFVNCIIPHPTVSESIRDALFFMK